MIVEAVLVREEFGLIAEVPFPDDAGGVALFLEDFGDRDLVGMNALGVAWHQNRVPGPGLEAIADRIGSGHQRRSGRRADRRGVEAG